MSDRHITEHLDISYSAVHRHTEKMLQVNKCGTIKELIAKHHGRITLAASKPVSDVREVLDEKEAAVYLNQKPDTLRQWRTYSKGPAYHKKGRRVFYKKNDLDAWVNAGRTFIGETPDAPY